MYNSVAYLINRISDGTVDDYGDPAEVIDKKAVFCNIMSIGTAEFYQAQTSGVKPELKIVIADYYDYNNELEVEVDSVIYQVLRTYKSIGSNELEITCYGGVRENECSEVSNED